MKIHSPIFLTIAVALPLFAVACDETIEATKAPTTTDSGTDSGPTQPTTTLYQRLGQKPGIAAFIDAVLTEELKDPEIAAFFAPNSMTPPPPGRPTMSQIRNCFVEMIANAASEPTAGDPVIPYPTKLPDGFQCRDMKTSHAGLGISSNVFDKFGAIATAVAMRAGLNSADLASVGAFLGIQKGLIVSAATDAGKDSTASADAQVDAPDGD